MRDTGGKSGRRPGRHLQVEASGPGNARPLASGKPPTEADPGAPVYTSSDLQQRAWAAAAVCRRYTARKARLWLHLWPF